jgi:hypothetical protein
VSVGWPVWPTTVGSWTSVPVDTWSGVGTSETLAWAEGPSGSFASGGGATGTSEWATDGGTASPAPNGVSPPASYWYYCTSPAGYFPHVQQCGSAWIPVIPQAPSAAGTPPQVAPMRPAPSRVAPAPQSTTPAQ